MSYKKWFDKMGYRVLVYGRGTGKSRVSQVLNAVFPCYATEVCIVAQKPLN